MFSPWGLLCFVLLTLGSGRQMELGINIPCKPQISPCSVGQLETCCREHGGGVRGSPGLSLVSKRKVVKVGRDLQIPLREHQLFVGFCEKLWEMDTVKKE